jgi:hypothetical protein
MAAEIDLIEESSYNDSYYSSDLPYQGENGLASVDMIDGKTIEFMADTSASEQAMLATLAKIMVMLHHQAKKCHDANDSLTKTLIKIETNNIVATHNGKSYVFFQVLAGGINIGFGLLASRPTVAKNMGCERIFEPLRGDITKGDAALQISRLLAKQGQNWSQPCQIMGTIADNSAQAARQQGMGEKGTLDTKHQSTSQISSKEDDAAKALIQLLQRLDEHKGQIAAAMLR